MDARIPESFEMSFTIDSSQDKRRLEKFFDHLTTKADAPPKPKTAKQIARHLPPAEARALHRQHDAHVAAQKLVDGQAVKAAHAVEMAARKQRRRLLTSSVTSLEKPVHACTREIARRLRQAAAARDG